MYFTTYEHIYLTIPLMGGVCSFMICFPLPTLSSMREFDSFYDLFTYLLSLYHFVPTLPPGEGLK